MRIRFGSRLLLCIAALCGACAAPDQQDDVRLGETSIELDDMGKPPEGMELLVLSSRASLREVTRTLDTLGGKSLHVLPPRMLVGKLPAGADAVLREVGVERRFARAVTPQEIGRLDDQEARFVRVFSSRYYPEATPRDQLVQPQRAVRAANEPFEAMPDEPMRTQARALAKDEPNPEELESNVFVPYASGQVVVSIILPESNGKGEPSSEDWSEQSIAETYAKVQAALEGIARHEPNAGVRFIMHYESAPAPGALTGTVDADFEYGKHARGSSELSKIYAQIFSGILNRPIGENDYYEAQRQYLQDLKQRYEADGAFIVYVAANGNYTAGFRAYASINGPSTSLDTSYGFETFMHEFGHIFGALDEYCPDQCISPSATQGYLGVVNANAEFRTGSWGGVRLGRGEAQPSLMTSNIANGVNGYTRGAWGWLDTDGDGLVEVRDTFPSSDLKVEVIDGQARLTGRVVDVPATPLWAIPYSVNRLVALHVRAKGDAEAPWVRLPLAGTRRGREDVDIALGTLADGRYELEVRAENSVGNLEPTPRTVAFSMTGARGTASPLVSLTASAQVVSPLASFELEASTLDFDREDVRVRFDVDGDGRFDTFFGTQRRITVRAMRPGVVTPRVEAMDASGHRVQASTSLYVLALNAPARAKLAALPSPVVGASAVTLAARASAVQDPERLPVEFNFRVERDDAARSFTVESGYGARGAYDTSVVTPPALPARGLDLSQLDYTIDRYASVYDVVRLSETRFAFALGTEGIVIADMTSAATPQLVSHVRPQSSAFDLELVGSTLFVLGDKLTAFDLKDPAAPVEIQQSRTTRQRRVLESSESWPIAEEPAKSLPFYAEWSERIDHVRIELEITHPKWEELTMALETPQGERIVLREHVAARRGQTTVTFDDQQLAALRPLIGRAASGEYRIAITDDVANGDKGSLTHTTISFDTSHRAFDTSLAGRQIVGTLRGRTLVLAGAGIETVDVSRPDALRSQGQLRSAPIVSAVLYGERAIVLSSLDSGDKDNPSKTPERVRGLFAVELQLPWHPIARRIDTAVEGQALGLAGSRLYVSVGQKDEARTRIGDVRSFVSGGSYWLADSEVVLGAPLFGDDVSVWSAQRGFARVDVRDPKALRVLEQFGDPPSYDVRFFDARSAFVVGPASELALVDLQGRTSVISQTYRVTMNTRDLLGAVDETTRTVHVVPYDHAPQIASARLARGTTTRDPYEIEVNVTDPDQHPSWDGVLALRFDWDGDGIWDGPFQGVWDSGTFSHSYTRGGDYAVRIQARDGFYALSPEVVLPVHVVEYVPVACTSNAQCPADEYCENGVSQQCGARGAGTCERKQSDCGNMMIEPVCGCDGVTYRNVCKAHEQSVAVASSGFCPGEVTQCGGPEQRACSVAGTFCRYPTGETPELSCGAGDAYGECVFQPEICFIGFGSIGIPRPGRMVCGCDGVSYPSYCDAERAGTSIAHDGSCEVQADCQQTGCAKGEVCRSCWGGYSCVPEDTAC